MLPDRMKPPSLADFERFVPCDYFSSEEIVLLQILSHYNSTEMCFCPIELLCIFKVIVLLFKRKMN